jgi:hypothetical protein
MCSFAKLMALAAILVFVELGSGLYLNVHGYPVLGGWVSMAIVVPTYLIIGSVTYKNIK